MASQVLDKTGVAFSGGGVRSAAFCSGVLRRLLQKRVTIDYLSSVSGGGYTAASYMDWKYHNLKKDDPAWHKEYFENLRKYSNPLCDCFNPVRGIVDGVLMVLVLLVLTVVLPLLKAFSFVIPVTFIVDSFVGEILRNQFNCRKVNITGTTKRTQVCTPMMGHAMPKILTITMVMFLLFLVSHYLAKRIRLGKLKDLFTYFYHISGFGFAMVFLPWVLEMFEEVTPPWADYLGVSLVLLVWVAFPSRRHYAFKTLVILVYAYFVKWTVFKTPLAGIEYTDELYGILVWISAFLLWIVPYLGVLGMYGGHLFEEWRLTRAYFSSESTGACCWHSHCKDETKALTFADLKGMKPEYKSNVTVNNWRKTNNQCEKDYEVFTFSPTVIERIDGKHAEFSSEEFIKPKDMRLSCAMTTSGSAVAHDDGIYQKSHKDSRAIRVVLGLGIGRNLVSQTQNTKVWMPLVVTFFVQLIFACAMIVVILVLDDGDEKHWRKAIFIESIVLIVYFALFGVISIIPIGSKGCYGKITRWCVINVFNVRLLRVLFDIIDVGVTPPPVLALSDGGHLENLGLLPLLKRRLSRIVVVNGGALGRGANYATDLLNALQQARDKLRCSFTSHDNRDVIEDIRDRFVEREETEQPRSYRFKVQYYEKDDGGNKCVGEGEILFLMPRHPNSGVRWLQDDEWSDFDGNSKIDLDESVWGPGPILKASDVDHLGGCCFECCHSQRFSRVTVPLLGGFPFHSTVNQLFTSSQHTAYHREGYHACVEAEADEFLNKGQSIEIITRQPQDNAESPPLIEVTGV